LLIARAVLAAAALELDDPAPKSGKERREPKNGVKFHYSNSFEDTQLRRVMMNILAHTYHELLGSSLPGFYSASEENV